MVDRAPPADLPPLPPLSEAPRCRRPPPAWTLTAARPLLPCPVRPPSLPPPLSAAAASRAIRPPVCCARETQACLPARLSPFPDVSGPASVPTADSSAAASARDAPPPSSPGGSGCCWLYIFFREFALPRPRCWDFGLIPIAHVSLLQLPPRAAPEAPHRLCRPRTLWRRRRRCRPTPAGAHPLTLHRPHGRRRPTRRGALPLSGSDSPPPSPPPSEPRPAVPARKQEAAPPLRVRPLSLYISITTHSLSLKRPRPRSLGRARGHSSPFDSPLSLLGMGMFPPSTGA